jgi:hypothetical protein
MASPRIDLRRLVLGRSDDLKKGLVITACGIVALGVGFSMLVAEVYWGLLVVLVGALALAGQIPMLTQRRSPPREPSAHAIAALRVSAAQAMLLDERVIDCNLLLWGMCCEPACRDALRRCGVRVEDVHARLGEKFRARHPGAHAIESYRSLATRLDEDEIEMGHDAQRVLERGRKRAQRAGLVLPLEWLVALVDERNEPAAVLLRELGIDRALLRTSLASIPMRASGDLIPTEVGTYGVVLVATEGAATEGVATADVIASIVEACDLSEPDVLFHVHVCEAGGYTKLGTSDEETARARVSRLNELCEARGQALRAYVENALTEVPLTEVPVMRKDASRGEGGTT